MHNYNIQRFIDAHRRSFHVALGEIKAGYKVSHWMWYIFPQIKGLGLEKNKNVSLAVFDANPGFGSLKSVQVMGVAELIEPMSETYISHAEYKKIPVKALENLADQGKPMNLLCISPSRMDVLCSDFKKEGYDSRQVLICQSE